METSRLQFIPYCAGVFFVLSTLFIGCKPEVSEDEERKPPNVLMILVDDLRPALGAYGDPLAITPNVDSLAKDAVTFQSAFTQQAVCAPSRNTLMTGLRPDGLGIYDLKTFFRTKAPNIVTLSQHFKNNGYHAEGMGKIYHEGHGNQNDSFSWSVDHWMPKKIMKKREPIERGDTVRLHLDVARVDGKKVAWYEYPLPEGMHHDALVADRALDRLEALKDSTFFLAVGLNRPHLPFNAPKKYWDLYDEVDFTIPDASQAADTPEYAYSNWGELRKYHMMPDEGPLSDAYAKKLIHGYYACVSFADAQIGKLIEKLKALDLYENTIIVLWGDHGYKLGEYGDWCKHTNFELDTRIPLMVRAPGMAVYGKYNASMVETVDLYPTLCDLAGLDHPQHLQGTSFTPLLENPQKTTEDVAFSQYPRKHIINGQKRRLMGTSMRTKDWRYTRWVDHGTQELVGEELYDHRSGREELTNLANDAQFTRVKAELAQRFNDEYQRAHQ